MKTVVAAAAATDVDGCGDDGGCSGNGAKRW